MKIREKIETINIYDLLDGTTLQNAIDKLEALKFKAYKNNYLNLELEVAVDYGMDDDRYYGFYLWGLREETQEEKEKKLAKNKKERERREKRKKFKEEDELSLLKQLAKKYKDHPNFPENF